VLSPQWLDELRARITLSSVIARTTKLLRAGREWKACCPFHSEKTPSFTVNDEKGFYHCFGCGAHGDVIRWMTDQRGLSFMDAVKELAAEAGMEVPAPDPRAAKQAEQRAGLHDVMAAAQDWFRSSLEAPGGEQARAYLESRGFDAHTVQRFGFGYAPEGRQALKAALAGKFEEPMLIEAGLRIAVDEKEPYDRFRGRLMLPIQDARGRVIAFGGRILDSAKTDAPKYLNSPDTPLFDKGRTLYNLHRAGPASRQTHRIVVVEGYMDVIALAAAGIEEAVAPLGTALTERQIELLWRMVDVPVLCFDGDAAGQRAAMRAVSRALPLLRPGHSKAGLKARLLEHVEAIQHPDIRSLYRRELMDRFSAFAFPPRAARERDWRQNRPAHPQLSPETANRLRRASGGARDGLMQAVIAGLARHPRAIHRHAEALGKLAPGGPAVGKAIDSLLDAAHALEMGEELPMAVALLVERPALEAALADATARFEQTFEQDAFEEQQRLLKRKLEFERRLGQMASERAAAQAPVTASSEPEGGAPDDRKLD